MSIGGAELEFERGRIRERQRDGIDRAKTGWQVFTNHDPES